MSGQLLMRARMSVSVESQQVLLIGEGGAHVDVLTVGANRKGFPWLHERASRLAAGGENLATIQNVT